ncbi:MAG: D-alanine--D-alanine ligase family protein [Flammeovirgaceae bacterium]
MKIGIFFGGQSREREISFAGGRTVYDNLNKGIFEPVPIFVDSLGNFIQLNWEYVYKGTIRDFYPPVNQIPASPNGFQIYMESLGALSEEALTRLASEVGTRIFPHQFKEYFDFAFLALHGPYGEDGNIQGLLEWYGLPYSGSGILPSAIGIDKSLQRDLLRDFGFLSPKSKTIGRHEWQAANKSDLFEQLKTEMGLPLVVKAAHQGSSIGVNIVSENNLADFTLAVERALFIEEIAADFWTQASVEEKRNFIVNLVDIRSGIGLPVVFKSTKADPIVIHHPEALLEKLNQHFEQQLESVRLSAVEGEDLVLFESFIEGKEFSCIVIQDEDGKPLALPPTQILKGKDVFDYRSKYLPGMVRKITPIDIEPDLIRDIQHACCEMYEKCHFNVYARIDGFITENQQIFLNDPNTTSGMMPSSFFFHQAAEIGLNPSQFLTYIIRTSLAERIKSGKRSQQLSSLLAQLDHKLANLQATSVQKTKVAVLLGGYSSERHISVESGRNIYEKLASSEKYEPIPVFLTGREEQHELYIIPTNILLKDNADDIREKTLQALVAPKHQIIAEVIEHAEKVTQKYAQGAIFKPQAISYQYLKEHVDAVFIALHGRPGEDGAVQTKLDALGIPYNGSSVVSSQLTIDKYTTNEKLRAQGISVAKHRLVHRADWEKDAEGVLKALTTEYGYPFIAKPADDGCSSAVKKVDNAEEFRAFASLMFRKQEELTEPEISVLNLKKNEEFPRKPYILIEELIRPEGADHFLEITGGLLTSIDESGNIQYEIFEPSEALTTGGILSLEEKFLAGEGQNITPARFDSDFAKRQRISDQVRADLEKTARILQIEGYARIDAFVRIRGEQAETIVIEANSLPGMTPATCIFHQTAINGYTPYDFIDKILEFGMQKQGKLVRI